MTFDHLAVVHGEVPPKRFWGREKRPGPQYVRGIVEGNGNPPGDDLWVVYSVSKEDIWISRIPVPVRWKVDGPIHDDFSTMETGGPVRDWNIYAPQWCPVEIVASPNADGKSLMLKDADPYDYAKAVRVFQEADQQVLTFDLYIESSRQVLDIDVVAPRGQRLVRMRIDTNRTCRIRGQDGNDVSLAPLDIRRWYHVEITLDNIARRFSVHLDGQHHLIEQAFAEPEGAAQRFVVRTGSYRLTDDVQEYKSGDDFKPGWDEPGADEPIEAAVYYLRNFSARQSCRYAPHASARSVTMGGRSF